jgi:hypothetical protein
MLVGIKGQVASGTLKQGAASHGISARMMVEGHRNLDQSLQKPAFGLGRDAPDILQDLVSFKETVLVEKINSVEIVLTRHRQDYSVAGNAAERRQPAGYIA